MIYHMNYYWQQDKKKAKKYIWKQDVDWYKVV